MEALNVESLVPFVVVVRISVFLPMAKRAVPKVATYYFYLLFVGFSKNMFLEMEAEKRNLK